MSEQTVSLRLTSDSSELRRDLEESGAVADQLAGKVGTAGSEIEASLQGATEATEELNSANQGAAGFWEEHSTAITGAGVAMAGAGAALEAFNQGQQDNRIIATRLANVLKGETTDSVLGLVAEINKADTDLDALIRTMEVGTQQGIRSGEQLQEYALFWDMVGDATGESDTALAQASSALRAVGVAAGQEGEALSAFGFIAQETTGSVGDFLKFLERTGPELGDMGVNIDQAAALLGLLEHEFGMSGRTARSEFRSAVSESDGTLQGLLDTLGVSGDQFDTYTGKVADSSEVIENNAAAVAETRTVMQKLQAEMENIALRFSGVAEAASMLSPVLMGAGGVVVAMNQLNQLSPRVATGLGRVAKGVGGLAVGIGALYLVKEGLDALGLSAQGLQIDIEKTSRAATDELVDSFMSLADSSAFAGEELDLFREVAEGNIGAAQRLRDGLADAGYETAELDKILADAAEAERRMADDTEAATKILDDQGDVIEDDVVPPMETLEESIRGVTDAFTAQFDPLFAATDAMLAHRDAQADVEGAQLNVLDATNDLNWAIAEHGKKSDEARDATFRLDQAERNLEDANRKVIRSVVDQETAIYNLKRQMEDGNVTVEAATAQLDQWVQQGALTEEQARQAAEELGLVAWNAGLADSIDINIPLTLDTRQFWTELANARVGLAMVQLEAQAGGARTSGLQLATGGLVPDKLSDPVYMASGGPMGTDTVPAWLTPGEYVVNADAVAAVGVDTMHRINRADRGETFASSVHAAPTGGGGGTIVVEVPVNLDGRRIGSNRAVINSVRDGLNEGSGRTAGAW